MLGRRCAPRDLRFAKNQSRVRGPTHGKQINNLGVFTEACGKCRVAFERCRKSHSHEENGAIHTVTSFRCTSGETSVRETEEFVLHPNKIKSLKVGECICIKKYPTSRAYMVKVFPETTKIS